MHQINFFIIAFSYVRILSPLEHCIQVLKLREKKKVILQIVYHFASVNFYIHIKFIVNTVGSRS